MTSFQKIEDEYNEHPFSGSPQT